MARNENAYYIAEIYGDMAYLYFGGEYLSEETNWYYRELVSRGYFLVFYK